MKYREREQERQARARWWLGPASDALDRFQRPGSFGHMLQFVLACGLGADRADDAGIVTVHHFRDIPGYGTLRQPMTVIVTDSP